MADVRILATGLGFPEGPVVCADGSVVLTEIRNRRCSRVTPDGKVSLFSDCGGGPNGLAIGPDGYFYLCNNGGSRYVEGHSMGLGPHPDYKFGTVERIDPKTGEAKLLYKEVNGHLLSAPNDLVFDKEGGFYFTDLGKRYPRHRDNGGVYYALPDGSKIVEVAYPILSPNGCGLSPDGKTLYVADTEGARLWAFEVQGPGKLKPKKEFLPHSGRVVAGLPRQRALRQPQGHGQRQYCRRDLEHRLYHRDFSGRRHRSRREDAGPLSDQYLLRRRRHAHGLHHPVRRRSIGRHAVAGAGVEAQLQLSSAPQGQFGGFGFAGTPLGRTPATLLPTKVGRS